MTITTCVGLYYGFTIFIVSLATAMTVMTLNIHHCGTSGRPVPPLVRTVCFRWLRRLLCLDDSGSMRRTRHQIQNIIEVNASHCSLRHRRLVQSCVMILPRKGRHYSSVSIIFSEERKLSVPFTSNKQDNKRKLLSFEM